MAGRKPWAAGPYLPLTSAAADVRRFFPRLAHVKRDVDEREGQECGQQPPRLSTLQLPQNDERRSVSLNRVNRDLKWVTSRRFRP